MSCTSKIKPYIKVGDSFDVPIRLINTVDKTGIEITPDMEFSCSIINVAGDVIATPTITPYPNQVDDKGFILLSVPTSVTATWSVGKALLDIKVIIGQSVKHSQDYTFDIRRSIT